MTNCLEKEIEENDDFTVDELYNLIKIEDQYCCGIDEVLGLLAEYIGDKRIEKEVDKYIDAYYESIGLKGGENE